MNAADETLDRAERAASSLRQMIVAGEIVPGQRLSESAMTERLEVSRNTLREAFRMLTAERLLTRRPNAGVFVAVPSLASILDIYRVRRMIEVQALRAAPGRHPAGTRMREAVERALQGREAGDWAAVGTANMEFHTAIVALADSERLDRVYANVSAELRLAFGFLEDLEYLHAPYIELNQRVLALHTAGDTEGAAQALDEYLVRSERTVLAAYARIAPEPTI
ncbi:MULTISPECIES: GntR family transcriptional regulator [unclassified Pseudoclavibacter]|uniref:GntR family transcriptional regulator n=1 Tax=unclassified Pseudoclavibacter TaxID=2615177 RepID=UPI000CE86864|nr:MULTISPECIES: GntR family transcriptional regulator [unclassified Pseudoclavibacter]PPG29128.1 GntR family transcriptional regulator [Pseudoclavibacter sp. RFBB5]